MTTKKSVQVANIDAVPSKLNKASAEGKIRVWQDTVALLTTDIDAADIIQMAELPSNAKVLSIKIFNDDLDTNGTPTLAYNLGIYNGDVAFSDGATDYAAQAVIDADAYAAAETDLQAANTAGAEKRFNTLDINTAGNYLWEDAGLSADPVRKLRICLTISTGAATAAAGDVTMQVLYMVE